MLGVTSPSSIARVVVLPAALAPKRAQIDPRSMVKLHLVDGAYLAEALGYLVHLDCRQP